MRLEPLDGAPKATRIHADASGRLWAWGDGPPDVSHDGGATWRSVALPGVARDEWIACRDIRADGERVLVVASDTFLSEDGGASFVRCPRTHPLDVVAFASESVVFGIACDYHSKADRYTSWFFRSADLGRTFATMVERDGMFVDVVALGKHAALLVDGSTVLRTEDDGRSWVALPDVCARRFVGQRTPELFAIWESEVRVSTDGGRTWRTLMRDESSWPFDDACVDGSTICAIRARSATLSLDGGKTVSEVESPSRLRGVACARGGVFVSGDGGLARVVR